MKAVSLRAYSDLPLDTILGRMVHANDLNNAPTPIDSWSEKKASNWVKDVLLALKKQRGHNPLENFEEAQFAILPTQQVAAGIQLSSKIIALTTGYLDYLSLIATHISATQAMRRIEEQIKATGEGMQPKALANAQKTLTRLHIALGLGHLEGVMNCADVLSTIQPLGLQSEITNRYSNWILFTFLHELGHLDIYQREILIPSLKEELYCDAFSLKGWQSDKSLIGYVSDILVLFTYQWSIDLRYHGQKTHPPTFDRARMILDTMNIKGIFDDLTTSLEKYFWTKGDALIIRENEEKMNDIASLRYEKEVICKQYSKAANLIFKLADFVLI